MNDYIELERLAEAAPEGPWFGPEYAPGTSYVFDVDLGTLLHYESIDTEQDACLRYVAAANPAAVLALIAENKRLMAENIALTKTTGAAMFLTLTDELAELRKKLTTVHFVCDRLPDPEGCRFIELENPQGESLGDESGKWEIRPDGLAQLVVEIASPDAKRMAALLECAQGDLKQAMQIIESQTAERQEWQRVLNMTEIPREGGQSKYSLAIKDAERYRFLRRTDSWSDIDFDDHGLWIVNARDEVINQDGVKLDAAVDAAMSKEAGHDQDSKAPGTHEDLMVKTGKMIMFSNPDRRLPSGCWEWVVPKGTKGPCRTCSWFGTIQTGIDEAPSTVCNACDGTGKEKDHDQP